MYAGRGGIVRKGIRSERRGKFVGGVRPSLRSCLIHYRLYLISSAAVVFSAHELDGGCRSIGRCKENVCRCMLGP